MLRPDSVQGSEAWHRLMQREDSVVSDNLYGQFKSQWACPLCRKASVVFDPFSLATLEIPDIHLRRMSVLLFRHVDDTSLASAQDAVPRLVTVKVCDDSPASALPLHAPRPTYTLRPLVG